MEVEHSNSAIAQRVREARIAAGLSQSDMGDKLGLSEAGYGHYERGRQPFQIQQLFDVARVVGRSVSSLLGLEQELTERQERLLAIFRRAEHAGLGEVVNAIVFALVRELLRAAEDGDARVRSLAQEAIARSGGAALPDGEFFEEAVELVGYLQSASAEKRQRIRRLLEAEVEDQERQEE